MKNLIALILILPSYFYCQNADIEITIINDTIKKVSYYDNNNIAYQIKSNSDVSYIIVIDPTEFSDDIEYRVEPDVFGMLQYYIFDRDLMLNPVGSSRNYEPEKISDYQSKAYQVFKKKYSKLFNDDELKIAYRLSKNSIELKAHDERLFVTKIDFPFYKSKYVELKNKKKYEFQISLDSSKTIIDQYFLIISKEVCKDCKIFTGKILSNKVPLLYDVYNTY